ncbi:purple acid phosphatase family protein [Clostridium oryzae]|uniref:Alkaline phosphatase n=1 Tax=Clostridium oryzae TaxID=1450648 RepID=A0A1V4I9C3_9CLOT|nr:metallophosphoesterase family protein [Clostridium oryzae]OPJ56127.1 alkaline phosphatase precursor [Clostridium oryzae]
MRLKKVSIIVACIVTSTVLATSTKYVYASSSYNGTNINSSLNATKKPDHVTLTWAKDPKTTQTITWRTSTDVNNGEVQYSELNSSKHKTIKAVKELFKTSTTDNTTGSMNVFSVTLTDLKPETTYSYKVGDGDNWSDASTFKTESKNNRNTKFLIFGDSQSGNDAVPNYEPWHKTIQNAFNANKNANFFINMGDLVEKGQYYVHWNNWFNAAKGVINKIPNMPVQGNHETYDAAGWNTTKPQYFVNQFKVPQNGPDGYKGQVYSYDYGNAHFVVLDSQEEEEAAGNDEFIKAQAEWLDEDLSSTKKEWKFVLFHKTPYYNKASRANIVLEKYLDPIIEKHHVDVVFNGHDHGVSRTYAMKNGKYYSDFSKGTVYYVTGRSGQKYYSDLTSKVWDAFFYDPNDMPCYEVANIKGDKLTVNAYKQDGTKIDSLVIDKANPKNSTKMVLPTSYNVDTDNPEVAAIGADPRLVIYGTPIAFGSNQAEYTNGKAYANPTLIAAYLGGNYDAAARTLKLGSNTMKFDASDISSKGNISIDALNAKGFYCKYNTQFNMVMVEK